MSERLRREEAMAIAVAALPADAVVVGANGHISRVLYRLGDRPGSFYMIGSMGLASAIGLGIALSRPERTVVVFDGDGNVLMGLGSLATIAAKRPRRFVHLCFDNESHASTGGQRTLSARVALDRVAAGAGYAFTAHETEATGFRRALDGAYAADGPAFVLVKVRPGGLPPGTPRIPLAPEEIAARLRRWLAGGIG